MYGKVLKASVPITDFTEIANVFFKFYEINRKN
jgi:hypothetical protein